MNRLPVKVAARLMGADAQYIRTGLQQERLPFGWAVKTSSHWTYYISPVKFTEYTGIEIPKELVVGEDMVISDD